MLTLVLHPDQVQLLADELARAREQEIGGVLVAEQLRPDAFRLVDFSVQRSGGTKTCFVCTPSAHSKFLDDFFERTGANYSRFNYLGEWHSHPLFSAAPSPTDVTQMQSLVDEEPERRPFAVLLVARLADRGRLELCSIAFRPNYEPEAIDLSISPRPTDDTTAKHRSWVERLFAAKPKPTPELEVVFARIAPATPFVHDHPSATGEPTSGRRSGRRQ
jgi:hypothetical protein